MESLIEFVEAPSYTIDGYIKLNARIIGTYTTLPGDNEVYCNIRLYGGVYNVHFTLVDFKEHITSWITKVMLIRVAGALDGYRGYSY